MSLTKILLHVYLNICRERPIPLFPCVHRPWISHIITFVRSGLVRPGMVRSGQVKINLSQDTHQVIDDEHGVIAAPREVDDALGVLDPDVVAVRVVDQVGLVRGQVSEGGVVGGAVTAE